MNVVVYSSGMPFDGMTVRSKSLGGSESAAYYMARELARRGHKVVCFTSKQQPETETDGVLYVWHGERSQASPMGEKFEHYATNTPHDVLVAQRMPFAFHKPYAAKICIWQLHDLALYRTAGQMMGGTWQIDAVTCVSEWHRQQVLEVWGLNPAHVVVVPNGVDPELYAPLKDGELRLVSRFIGQQKPERVEIAAAGVLGPVQELIQLPADKQLWLYQSRPERGLEHLLRPGGIMERCKELNAHLIVVGYDNTMPEMRSYYEQLYAWGELLPNVTFLGALTKPQLAQLQQQCDLMVYPTEFDEVSCITAMEAMHAGLPLLTSHCAALPETCAESGTSLLPLKDGKADEDLFVTELTALSLDPERLHTMRERQLAAAQTRTWQKAADDLEALIDNCFARRRASAGAVLRSAIEHSDIGFADWYAQQLVQAGTPGATRDAISASAISEINRLYAFKDSPEAYAAHYAKHQTAYYDEFEERVIGEDVTATLRFRGTFSHIATHISKRNAQHLRVLDYGCAHGHYTIPIAKTLTSCDFVGMDISERAVGAARKWAERDAVTNVEFRQGSQEALKDEELGEFDVIIAGEVLEHVWDYQALLALLRGRLAPDGVLIITTPCGRWEHSGTVAFRTGREHLHHFEREDIEDICRGHELEVLHAPAGHDRSGLPLGSWVWAVWPKSDAPFGAVDYGRKLGQYAPRQTVSACMIAKDAEGTLRRCVESFIDWVDELIVCIDPTTTDGTEAVCAKLAEDFPNRAILYAVAEASATRDGFETARNESIAKASGDWILWIDADEELRHPYVMHRLARPSLHNGYGFAQVHYSVEPEQVLTMDYPCRLFRNHLGIKFYGMVHEHPELELGKAVPYSLVRPDMKFLHHGYFDEETRRRRYQRNLPLLQRDIEKYPDNRPLNKFLHLRDLAQGIQFESEQIGPQPRHLSMAHEGVRIMEQLAELPGQARMLTDAMPYYSLCVATTGSGFDAELTMKLLNNVAPDLSANLSLKGRFHSREFYAKLVNKFSQESTKHYEDRHL